MGTDIHIIGQRLGDDGVWRDIDTPESIHNRSYTFFTFLDGTRERITNGDRGKKIEPIAQPRGKPADVITTEEGYDTIYNGVWMGYGISSYCTLAEIFEHAKKYAPQWVAPIDDLEQFYSGDDPNKIRFFWGYDS